MKLLPNYIKNWLNEFFYNEMKIFSSLRTAFKKLEINTPCTSVLGNTFEAFLGIITHFSKKKGVLPFLLR